MSLRALPGAPADRPRARPFGAAPALIALCAACGDAPDAPPDAGHTDAGWPSGADAGAADVRAEDAGESRLPYAERLVRFSPGENAGFGQEELPSVVLGPPAGREAGGSLDVLSLGVGGEIVLDFGEGRRLVDGPGPDLVVFENPFYISGDPTRPFAELGEVAVSADGVTWSTFACDPAGTGTGRYPGCAGWTPTRRFDPRLPLDPTESGGDVFDLDDLGVTEARYVRIRDLADEGAPPSAGFDLDAIGAVHLADAP